MSQALKTAVTPDEKLLSQLRDLANIVLSRFSLVDGIYPLELITVNESDHTKQQPRQSYSINTRDGRSLSHLSTGQRTQMAISLLVAQNLAVTHMLSHRVLLLDDVTTAYDLSNLTREAILWRQLAYHRGEDRRGEDRARRQIFISSHHEDLTNHLLDLLVPPAGCSMRLLRFVGWSGKLGPKIQTLTVEPSRSIADKKSLVGLAHALESQL